MAVIFISDLRIDGIHVGCFNLTLPISYSLTPNIMAAHWALAAPLLNPILNASRVVKVITRAVKLSYHVVVAERRHTYNAFIFITDGTK